MLDLRAFLELYEFILARPAIAVGGPLFLVVGALWLLRPWMQRRRGERRVSQSIRRMGTASLQDVTLDNGMDGFAFIEYLVLNPQEILVVSRERVRGIVFGGDQVDVWARVAGRRTAKFPNPLTANSDRVLTVRYHVPQVPVRGVVLFEEGASFPKGKPEGVLLPEDISSEAARWQGEEVPAPLQAAWEHLTELGVRGQQTYSRELSVLRGEHQRWREAIAVLLLGMALAWGAWGGIVLLG